MPDSPENKCPGDFLGDDLSGVHTCHAGCPCHSSGGRASVPSSPHETGNFTCEECWGQDGEHEADCPDGGTTPSAPSAAPTNPGENQTEGEGEDRFRWFFEDQWWVLDPDTPGLIKEAEAGIVTVESADPACTPRRWEEDQHIWTWPHAVLKLDPTQKPSRSDSEGEVKRYRTGSDGQIWPDPKGQLVSYADWKRGEKKILELRTTLHRVSVFVARMEARQERLADLARRNADKVDGSKPGGQSMINALTQEVSWRRTFSRVLEQVQRVVSGYSPDEAEDDDAVA